MQEKNSKQKLTGGAGGGSGAGGVGGRGGRGARDGGGATALVRRGGVDRGALMELVVFGLGAPV